MLNWMRRRLGPLALLLIGLFAGQMLDLTPCPDEVEPVTQTDGLGGLPIDLNRAAGNALLSLSGAHPATAVIYREACADHRHSDGPAEHPLGLCSCICHAVFTAAVSPQAVAAAPFVPPFESPATAAPAASLSAMVFAIEHIPLG